MSFLQYVRPALLTMLGRPDVYLPTLRATLAAPVSTKKGFLFFLRARLERRDDGLYATTTGPQGSGISMSMAQADCLVVVPEHRDRMDAGEDVTVQLLPGPAPGQVGAQLRRTEEDA